jgi:hypothetical protein
MCKKNISINISLVVNKIINKANVYDDNDNNTWMGVCAKIISA